MSWWADTYEDIGTELSDFFSDGLTADLRALGSVVAPPATSVCGLHANDSRSKKTQTIYQLIDSAGKVLKIGISSDIARRYTKKFLASINASVKKITTVADRRTGLKLEKAWRYMGWGGPLNKERH